MKYLSLFSGVEAATLAWEPLGWQAVAFSQFDPENDYSKGLDFPSSVLAHHWPNVPNLGDITKVTEKQIKQLGHIDVVVFGSPCQDLSIAGARKGLEGERSGLFRSAIRVIKWCKKHCGTRFALWENVPGCLSSNQGQDFCEVLSSLCGSRIKQPEKWSTAGFCFGKSGLVEWCVLDAQYFGVPQRRRRVFAFADFGNWTDREPILPNSESVSGDIESSREEGQSVTCNAGKGAKVGSHWDDVKNPHPTLTQSHSTSGIAMSNQEIFGLRGAGLVSDEHAAFVVHGTQDPIVSNNIAHALGCNHGQENAICFHQNGDGELRESKKAYTVATNSNASGRNTPLLRNGLKVRRLTPIESERLQGMPDCHTKIPFRGKLIDDCPDGHRYKAIGNSMAVPVMKWLGERIASIEL